MNRFLTIFVVMALAHTVWRQLDIQWQPGSFGVTTADEIVSIASSVRGDDVIMYSTDSCPYAAQAKTWLKANGFAFTECNMSVDRRCEQEFLSYGGDGTPYLIARGHHMRDGFDSEEFLAALRR